MYVSAITTLFWFGISTLATRAHWIWSGSLPNEACAAMPWKKEEKLNTPHIQMHAISLHLSASKLYFYRSTSVVPWIPYSVWPQRWNYVNYSKALLWLLRNIKPPKIIRLVQSKKTMNPPLQLCSPSWQLCIRLSDSHDILGVCEPRTCTQVTLNTYGLHEGLPKSFQWSILATTLSQNASCGSKTYVQQRVWNHTHLPEAITAGKAPHLHILPTLCTNPEYC